MRLGVREGGGGGAAGGSQDRVPVPARVAVPRPTLLPRATHLRPHCPWSAPVGQGSSKSLNPSGTSRNAMRKKTLASVIMPLAQGTSRPTAQMEATSASTMVTERKMMLRGRRGEGGVNGWNVGTNGLLAGKGRSASQRDLRLTRQ